MFKGIPITEKLGSLFNFELMEDQSNKVLSLLGGGEGRSINVCRIVFQHLNSSPKTITFYKSFYTSLCFMLFQHYTLSLVVGSIVGLQSRANESLVVFSDESVCALDSVTQIKVWRYLTDYSAFSMHWSAPLKPKLPCLPCRIELL